jgi:hypothetical protein
MYCCVNKAHCVAMRTAAPARCKDNGAGPPRALALPLEPRGEWWEARERRGGKGAAVGSGERRRQGGESAK